MKTIEEAIQELKGMGASIQITVDLEKVPTVHAFHKNYKLRQTDGTDVLTALQSMILKLKQLDAEESELSNE